VTGWVKVTVLEDRPTGSDINPHGYAWEWSTVMPVEGVPEAVGKWLAGSMPIRSITIVGVDR